MVQMLYVIVVAKRHLFFKLTGPFGAIVTTMDEAVFRTYIAEFNAVNFDALARYYADDVVFSCNGGRTLTGRDRPRPKGGAWH